MGEKRDPRHVTPLICACMVGGGEWCDQLYVTKSDKWWFETCIWWCCFVGIFAHHGPCRRLSPSLLWNERCWNKIDLQYACRILGCRQRGCVHRNRIEWRRRGVYQPSDDWCSQRYLVRRQNALNTSRSAILFLLIFSFLNFYVLLLFLIDRYTDCWAIIANVLFAIGLKYGMLLLCCNYFITVRVCLVVCENRIPSHKNPTVNCMYFLI